MIEIEDFKGKIEGIEDLRNHNHFSIALEMIEKLKKEISEQVDEEYEGQIFVGPIGNFTTLGVKCQRLISRLVYEEGKTNADIGAIPDAKNCFETALKMRKETLKLGKENKENSVDVAYSLFELARTELALCEGIGPSDLMREAEKATRKAIKVSENDIFHLGKMYHNLGFILSARGKINKAIITYKKALEIQKESGDIRGHDLTSVRISKCYFNIAMNHALNGMDGFYKSGDKSRVSEGKKQIRDVSDLCEMFFRKHEVVSYDNGGWGIKSSLASKPGTEVVSYESHKRTVVILSYLVDDMSSADERFLEEGSPEALFSLLPYKFLDKQRDKYVELTEFLNLYDGCDYKVREQMKVGRINWWTTKINNSEHLAGIQLSDFETAEDRKQFVRKSLRQLYKALYTCFQLARMSEAIVEPASLKKISKLWIDYLLDTDFLEKLEKTALYIVKKFGFEPEIEEDELGFTVDAVKKIFDLAEVQAAQRFPEIIEKQKNRKTQ